MVTALINREFKFNLPGRPRAAKRGVTSRQKPSV
jgi:hypothetical protein